MLLLYPPKKEEALRTDDLQTEGSCPQKTLFIEDLEEVAGGSNSANVQKVQEGGRSNFRRYRTMNQWANLSAHTPGSKKC